MNAFFNGRASKALVAVFTAAASALTTYFGTARWEPAALAVLGAVMVWLVPNSPKPPGPPPATGL
jgi:hypothetical protein